MGLAGHASFAAWVIVRSTFILAVQHFKVQVLKELRIALLEQLLGELLRIFELLGRFVKGLAALPIVYCGVVDALLIL